MTETVRTATRWWMLTGVTVGLVLVMAFTGTVAFLAGMTGYAPLGLAFAPIAVVLTVVMTRRALWRRLGFRRPAVGSSARWTFLVALLPATVILGSRGIGVGGPEVLGFAGLAILVAFVEEVLFRGVLLRAFAPSGWIVATSATSVAFALAHSVTAMSPGADTPAVIRTVAFALAFGVVASMLTLVTESIVPAIVLHTTFDWAGFVFAPRSAAVTDTVEITLCAVLAVVLVVIQVRTTRSARPAGAREAAAVTV